MGKMSLKYVEVVKFPKRDRGNNKNTKKKQKNKEKRSQGGIHTNNTNKCI